MCAPQFTLIFRTAWVLRLWILSSYLGFTDPFIPSNLGHFCKATTRMWRRQGFLVIGKGKGGCTSLSHPQFFKWIAREKCFWIPTRLNHLTGNSSLFFGCLMVQPPCIGIRTRTNPFTITHGRQLGFHIEIGKILR